MSDTQIQQALLKAKTDIKPGIPGRGIDTRVRQWNFVKLLRRLVLTYPQGRAAFVDMDHVADGILHLAMAVNINSSTAAPQLLRT